MKEKQKKTQNTSDAHILIGSASVNPSSLLGYMFWAALCNANVRE
jgi:hypothetical protein